MRDPIVFDDGVRLTDTLRTRVPPGFRDQIATAAAIEGIAPAEFQRRALAERIVRVTAPGRLPASETTETTEPSHG